MEYAPETGKKYMAPFNHTKRANNLLIVIRGNWSKLIHEVKGCRRLEKRRASIIAHKQSVISDSFKSEINFRSWEEFSLFRCDTRARIFCAL